ncbi:MAG TPA: Calx-beta domain-containing protein, partial [Pyrinomonadaceae bacterium]|nr:Calx-beta domain-containing protein [Pyrinomonadaceae bacterium]
LPAGPGPGQGGGVYNLTGTINITNSTIAGNLATGPEGQPSRGGGVYSQSGVVNLKSTIVASNTAPAVGNDISGPVTSHGFNLIQDPSDSSIIQQPTDIFGTVPKLGTLGNHGGRTQTIALLTGSPAIDKGTRNGLTGPLSTDQRGAGFPRPVNDPAIPNAAGGDGTDIGAFEVQPTVRFSVAAYNVSESGGQATITVRRTALNGQAATVRFATSNGTATAGKDYTAKSGTLSFAATETTKTFTVAITDDALDEANETINLTLGSPTGGMTLGTPNKAVLTIADNDAAPALAVGNATLTEGSGGALYATFNVSLSAPSGKTVTVKYATANGTAAAPADYEARAGTLSFAPGQTTKSVTVGVRGDLLDEATETFFVNLSGPLNATIADAQGIGTITDNDPLPSLTIGNATVTEVDAGTTNVTLTVKLSAASGKAVSVNYATANGTASSSGDYVAKSGTLSFAAGQTAATIVVQVRGDLLKEANETFFVNLGGAVNATIADNQGQVTIVNDD